MSSYRVTYDLNNISSSLPVVAARAHAAALSLEADFRDRYNIKSILDSATALRDALVEALAVFGPASNTITVKHLRDALMVVSALIEVAGPAAAQADDDDAGELDAEVASSPNTTGPCATARGADVFAFPPSSGTADLAATV